MFTLGNLVCGFFAIVVAARVGKPQVEIPYLAAVVNLEDTRNIMLSGCLIFLAMVFDGLDGYVARLARISSDFGAQLDSLLPGKYSVFITAPNHKPLRLVNKDALLLESGQEVEIKVPLQAAPGAEPEKATA